MSDDKPYDDGTPASRQIGAVPAETIHLRLKTRPINAIVTEVYPNNPHISRCTIVPSLFERIVQALLGLLPIYLFNRLQNSFPEWLMPSDFILKRQKDGQQEEFNREEAAFKKLRYFQGIGTPRYWGTENGIPALVLSDVGGVGLSEPEAAGLGEADVLRLFEQTLSAFATCGVAIAEDGLRLDNFHLIGDGNERSISIVNLEHAEEVESLETLDRRIRESVAKLVRDYRQNLESLRSKGLIPH